ncbi:MAG TPA: beta-propeller fold lactonase family protein, partial [Roseiflexaceae bacterium]|nr:beta-propeller fold lactonase family protein [Roseiflexaceae bacterium]
MNQSLVRHSIRRRTTALLATLAAIVGLLAPAAGPANASIIPATITVTKTALENTDGDGCSLYEALQASFNGATYHQCTAGPDANIIVFSGAAAGGTITFPAKPNDIDLPMINRNVTITGPVVLNGNGANTDQHIFRIAPGGTLNLANMVIKNAHTSGGGAAILDLNFGTLNILGVSFDGNVAEGDGGAINSNGTVNIISSNFTGNKAQGINPDKSISSATGYGGAINMSGSDALKVALSNFSGNSADKGGGAIYASAKSAELSDVVLSGNLVTGTGSDDKAPKGGGAIYNDADATLKLVRTALSGNLTPTSSGGAIYNNISATAVISQTSFNGNIAASPGNSASGGAIYNGGGSLALLQDSFLNNAVVLGDGGAIANDRHGSLSIANSSFIANAAASGNGGAINNTNTQQGGPVSSVVVKNVTFSSNAAINSASHGGAIFNAQGHSFTLGNTIVDNSVGDNCTGAVSSLGHNLESANTCSLAASGDLPNANPQLDLPAFNGGPLVSLLTQKLKPGSQAIDAGDPAICAADPVNNIDQRGEARPKGPACDIGSFESDPLIAGYGSTPVQPGPIDFGSAVANSGSADASLTIIETGNATLQVGSPQFSGANAGDFSVKAPSPFPISIADGGADRIVTLTCAPTGSGPRSATLGLDTNDPAHPHISYTLTCAGTTLPQPAFGSKPIAPGPIDLGQATINTSVSASFLISDTGDANLHLSSPAFGGANPADFALLTGGFPLTIAPNASQSIAVQCTPSALGIRTASLAFSTDDPNRPSVSFTLTCEGQPAPPPILEVPGQSHANPLGTGANGPYGVATSPDGRNVYATDYGDDLLMVFSRDPLTGNITFLENKVNSSGGVAGLDGPYLVAVSADGKNVYAASGNGDSIVSFTRNPSDGTLSFLSKVGKGDNYGFCLPTCLQLQALDGAYGIALSADGQYAYVSSILDNKVVVLNRNSATGALELQPLLGPVQTYASASISQAYGIALSPDGANLYLTGYGSDNLEVLKRDPSNGQLTFVERYTNGQLGVDGLNGVFRVTVSPDGAFVYTASFDDSAITVFKRDQSTGKLTYITRYKDGIGGVSGLVWATSVTISPDGKHLFATAFQSDAVSVFDRDTASGLLTQKQVIQRDAGSGLPALDGARDVAIDPTGQTICVTGFNDNKVTALHAANPVPALFSLAPASAQAGGAAFTLAVNGEGFVPGAQVTWNGSARATSFVNNTKLTAQIGAADIAAAGTTSVAVVNPTPGGGSSNTLQFTITAPGQNPV